MKGLLLTLPFLALGAAGTQDAQEVAQDAAAARSQAAEVFTERCASCHLPPDPAFAVDRAWLHQLADTA